MRRFAGFFERRLVLALLLCFASPAGAADSKLLLYGTEGNRLRRYDIDTIGAERLVEEILIERATAGEFGSPTGPGRDVNGQICEFPDGSGRFVAGEDTNQPNPTAGWGIFDKDGVQIGKLTPTYPDAGPEPAGCAFDPDTGILYTASVGSQGFGPGNGQLIMWFPPFDGYPGAPGEFPGANPVSTNFCKLSNNIGTAGSVLVDPEGRVLVASAGQLRVDRFNPPFPTSPDATGGCDQVDAQGSPFIGFAKILAPRPGGVPYRETGLVVNGNGLLSPTGLALSPTGTLYVSSVVTGVVNEYDLETGAFIRTIVANPNSGSLPNTYGSPQGLTVTPDGTIYYADLDLRGDFNDPNTIGPGPDGKVWRVRFDGGGAPKTPEIVRDGLSFPDGVSIFAGNLQQKEWTTFAGGAARLFANRDESIINFANVNQLSERWKLPTSAVITVSPSVAAVDIPGEGLTRVVYFQSWNLDIYAARMVDGSILWRYGTEDQPGASFPSAASVTVAKVDNRDQVFVGSGHNMYALDAVTGEEIWRFTAGTGCGYDDGSFPGSCGFSGERNQIESTTYVARGRVFFGMDVNDVATGKGGFFALDASDGRMRWFFDLESGMTCRPDPTDEIRKYDGYHSEAELELPAGFFGSRAGCDHPRNTTGCSNVWSSPAVDMEREALFVASSNCDTPDDPDTGLPETMPPFDEAIFSLDFDGNVRWVWRPRDFDVEDLAFGGVPNLFEIETQVGGVPTLVDVVGVGNKDGTYYVLDRDGVNQMTGEAWDDDPASHLPANLPYWSTQVVPGGDIGGIIATAAVDTGTARVFFATAPGLSGVDSPPGPPQTPTTHALNLDDGSISWQNTTESPQTASFSSTSWIPGVAFTGTAVGANLRGYFTGNGGKLSQFNLMNAGMGSTPIVIDGTLLVGSGIGTRTATGSSISDQVTNLPSTLWALCVPGTAGCAACNDGIDNDRDGDIDVAQDDGCAGAGDNSEVAGDLDYDNDVDDRDRNRFFAAFGRASGQVGYVQAADLDPPGAPDGIVGLVDYQRWLAAEDEFLNPPAPVCGLLGVEAVFAIGGARWMSRRRRQRKRGASAAENRSLPKRLLLAALITLGIATAPRAEATTTLQFVIPPSIPVSPGGVLQVEPGESHSFDIVADMDAGVVGWGFDLEHDGAAIRIDATAIGPLFFPVFTPDGDGLGGLAPAPGVSGNGILLATVGFTALAEGLTELTLSISDDDVTEGFALLGIGEFDDLVYPLPNPLRILVTPEPNPAVLMGIGLAGLAFVGRRRRRRR